jgi:alkyl sulfatase BDS1-like metallo-beta-lactamase superfamily hydrolase
VLNWTFNDTGERFVLTLENCALTSKRRRAIRQSGCELHAGAGTLDEVIATQTSFPEAIAAGKIKVSGNPTRLPELMGLMDEFPHMFEIVEPKRVVGR